MWEQMTEAMAALAENGNQKELVQGELLKWMGQVPLVLQGILSKSSGMANYGLSYMLTQIREAQPQEECGLFSKMIILILMWPLQKRKNRSLSPALTTCR